MKSRFPAVAILDDRAAAARASHLLLAGIIHLRSGALLSSLFFRSILKTEDHNESYRGNNHAKY